MSNEIIHPTAVIEPGAEIGSGVTIGPFCHIGARVKIGDHTRLHAHVVMMNHVHMGAHGEIFPGAVLGAPPQDTKYQGEDTVLEIGNHNVVREHVTMHTASVGGDGVTRIGHHGMFMAGSHVAHDCVVGDHVTLINHVVLGGHVKVADGAVIGGNSAVHQHVRIGMGAMIGGMSGVESDVIPFGMAKGDRAALNGLNWVGLERRGFTSGQIKEMRRFYKDLFEGEGNFADRIARVRVNEMDNALLKPILDFISAPSRRGFCQPETRGGA